MKKTDYKLPFKKNDIVELEITAMSSDGTGIAKKDGFVIFVENGVEGDVCRARILKCLTHRAYAKVEQLITPSECRIEPDCAVFYKCGGCRFRNVTYESELKFKVRRVNDDLKRIAGTDITCERIIAAPDIIRYRNKALMPVGRDKDGRIVIGFYRKNSHDIISADDCLIQNEAVGRIKAAVAEYMRENNVEPYDECSGSGSIRRIFVRSSASSGEVMVAIISAERDLPNTDEIISGIRTACSMTCGIILNVNKSAGNAAFGGTNVLLFGRDYIEDKLCGIKFKISAQAFFQINPRQAERLYEQAIKMARIDKDTDVLDLYCGAGTITLCMAKAARRAVGVEIVSEAVENAAENARINGITNAEFICADAGAAAQRLAEAGYCPNVITVDPPRKGLDMDTIDAMVRMKPERIVYISCNPSTMARDIKILTENEFELKNVCAADMFPRTEHVETVCLLSKPNANHHMIGI